MAFSAVVLPLPAADEGIRIEAESLTVRSGPDTGYAAIGTVFAGQIYVSVDEVDGYREIWFNRARGWVHSDQVELRSTSYDSVSRGTNVRSGPRSSYPKVGYAKSGSRWALIGTSASGNWHQIFYEGAQYWYYARGRAQTLEYVAPEAPVSVAVEEAVRITAPTLTVYSGPGATYNQVGTVLEDQVYLSTEVFDGWRQIWYSREQGWVAEGGVTVVSAEYDVVDWDWLNVRTGPGLEFTKITSVPKDSKWVSVSYTGSWHEIQFEGAVAWLSGVGVTTYDYVAPSGESPSPTESSVGFLKMPASGPGFIRRCGANNPDHAWGSLTLVNGLIAACEAWSLDHADWPRIRVGDLSLPDGGVFADGGSSHISHQNGTDVDIFLLRTDASDEGAPDLYDPLYSSERTREWIENYLAAALPEVTTHGMLLNDHRFFGKLTTVSSRGEICPGEGCPLDEFGNHEQPRLDGLPFVRCNPGHSCHMHVRTAP